MSNYLERYSVSSKLGDILQDVKHIVLKILDLFNMIKY